MALDLGRNALRIKMKYRSSNIIARLAAKAKAMKKAASEARAKEEAAVQALKAAQLAKREEAEAREAETFCMLL